MRIKEILQAIEQIAPLSLQEDFDNSGVQVGDINREITGVLLCIDVTENVIDEALSLGCNLVIAHHPLAFRPFKSLTGQTYIERCMMKAIKNDLCVYASHTNLDNARSGVNYKIAEMLGLQQVRILSPQKGKLLKLVTFCARCLCRICPQCLVQCRSGKHRQLRCLQLQRSGRGYVSRGRTCQSFCG